MCSKTVYDPVEKKIRQELISPDLNSNHQAQMSQDRMD